MNEQITHIKKCFVKENFFLKNFDSNQFIKPPIFLAALHFF